MLDTSDTLPIAPRSPSCATGAIVYCASIKLPVEPTDCVHGCLRTTGCSSHSLLVTAIRNLACCEQSGNACHGMVTQQYEIPLVLWHARWNDGDLWVPADGDESPIALNFPQHIF